MKKSISTVSSLTYIGQNLVYNSDGEACSFAVDSTAEKIGRADMNRYRAEREFDSIEDIIVVAEMLSNHSDLE